VAADSGHIDLVDLKDLRELSLILGLVNALGQDLNDVFDGLFVDGRRWASRCWCTAGVDIGGRVVKQ